MTHIEVPKMRRWVPGTELPPMQHTDDEYEGDEKS